MKTIRYIDDAFEERDGYALQRNGNLTYVMDADTLEADWRAPHEIVPPKPRPRATFRELLETDAV